MRNRPENFPEQVFLFRPLENTHDYIFVDSLSIPYVTRRWILAYPIFLQNGTISPFQNC